jgi:hypothetical protein
MESRKLGMKTAGKDLKSAVCKDVRLPWISIQMPAVCATYLLQVAGRR